MFSYHDNNDIDMSITADSHTIDNKYEDCAERISPSLKLFLRELFKCMLSMCSILVAMWQKSFWSRDGIKEFGMGINIFAEMLTHG